jgi:hypothetical protein
VLLAAKHRLLLLLQHLSSSLKSAVRPVLLNGSR